MDQPAQVQPLYDNDLESVEYLGLGTKLISLGVKEVSGKNKPMVTPIYQSSTYYADSCEGFGQQLSKGYGYGRVRNPNADEVELAIANIENGKGSIVFPSGMAAIYNALMCFVKPGDHIVAQSPIYSGTSYVLKNICQQNNVEVSYVPGDKDVDEYRKAVQSNTTILYGETLGNPMMNFLDVEKLGKIGKKLNILTIVDATFTPPTNIRPLDYGIDIVLHSGTKYLCGHSDMLTGCATFNDLKLYAKLRTWRTFTGSIQSAQDSSLLMRSLRTLHLRSEQHNKNAMAVAKFLQGHALVTKVHYIGLGSHPQHSLAARTMQGYGGMMAIELESQEKAVKFAEATRVFKLAVSLGGVESLIEHPGTMTHGKALSGPTSGKKDSCTIPDTLVRLSVGLESSEDQIADLQRALKKSQLTKGYTVGGILKTLKTPEDKRAISRLI